MGNSSPAPTTGILCGLIAALIWGAWPVLSRLGVEQSLGAYDITALRFAIAGIILFPIIWRRGFGGVPFKAIAILTIGAGVPYMLVMLTGLGYAPAGHAGVITPSCMLTFSALGSWALMGERPNRSRLVGLAMIIGGVLIIGWNGFSKGGSDAWIGDMLFALGGILWGSYTLANRFFAVEPLLSTALVSVSSMVLFVPLYLAFNVETLISAPVDGVIFEIIFQGLIQGVFAGVLALLFYTRAVAILGAAKGSIFGALVPATALLLAYPVLGEVPSSFELLGLILVSFGMITALGVFPEIQKISLTSWEKRRRTIGSKVSRGSVS